MAEYLLPKLVLLAGLLDRYVWGSDGLLIK